MKHLCGVPLCGLRSDSAVKGLNVRKSPTKVTPRMLEGREVQVPDCIPFEMPDLCCAGVVE